MTNWVVYQAWKENDEAITTLLVGGMLSFFTFLLIPHFILFGYFIRVLTKRSRGDDSVPRFDDWVSLIRDGSHAFVIWVIWTALPLAIAFMVFQGEIEPGEGTLFLLGMILPGNILTVVNRGAETELVQQYAFAEPYLLSLLVLYFFPASLYCYLQHGTIRAAFTSRYLQPILTNRRYFVAWIGFAFLWFLAEAPIRLWEYGIFFVPVSFFLKVSAWSIIGRGLPAVGMSSGDVSGSANVALDEGYSANESTRRSSSLLSHWARERSASLPLKAYLGGGFLLSLSLYLLPGILVVGYLMGLFRPQTADTDAPLFDDLRQLFTDGVRAYVVWLIYLLVPLVLLAFSSLHREGQSSVRATFATWALISGVGLPGGYPAVAMFLVGSFAVVVLLGFAVTLLPVSALSTVVAILNVPAWIAVGLFAVGMFVIPAALFQVANDGTLRAAFKFMELRRTIWNRSYPLKWGVMFMLTLPGWVALSWAYIMLFPSLITVFPDTPIVKVIFDPNLRVLLPLPASVSSIRSVVTWTILMVASLVHFWLLVAASGYVRLMGRSL